MSAYKLQFDIANSTLTENLLHLSWMLAMAAVGLVMFLIGRNLGRGFRGRVGALGLVFMLGGAVGAVSTSLEVVRLRQARTRGAFQVAEGCLTLFHAEPAARRRAAYDRVRVNGSEFTISTGNGLPNFHMTEATGSPIHPDSRVRLGYVGNDILRVETVDHACPPAPDFNGSHP